MMRAIAAASTAAALVQLAGAAVTVLLDGQPAAVGDYDFENGGNYRTLVLDNGKIRFEFGAGTA